MDEVVRVIGAQGTAVDVPLTQLTDADVECVAKAMATSGKWVKLIAYLRGTTDSRATALAA